jgi:hypothetical protein
VAVHSAWPVLCRRTLVPRMTRVLAHYHASPFAQNNTTSGPAGARPWPGKVDKGSARDSVDVAGKCRASSHVVLLAPWIAFMARRLISLLCLRVHIGEYLSAEGRAGVGVRSTALRQARAEPRAVAVAGSTEELAISCSTSPILTFSPYVRSLRCA